MRLIVKNEVYEKNRLPHERLLIGPLESRDALFVDEIDALLNLPLSMIIM